MDSTKKTARVAGLLYVLLGIPAVFGLIYVPGKLIVRGDATATAHNSSPSLRTRRSRAVRISGAQPT